MDCSTVLNRLAVSLAVQEQWEDLEVTHHAAAHPGGSGSPETDVPTVGRGPSSHATTGPQCAPASPCALLPAANTDTAHAEH